MTEPDLKVPRKKIGKLLQQNANQKISLAHHLVRKQPSHIVFNLTVVNMTQEDLYETIFSGYLHTTFEIISFLFLIVGTDLLLTLATIVSDDKVITKCAHSKNSAIDTCANLSNEECAPKQKRLNS